MALTIECLCTKARHWDPLFLPTNTGYGHLPRNPKYLPT